MKQTPNTSPPLSIACLEDPLFKSYGSTFLVDPSTKQHIQVRSITVTDEQYFQTLIQNLEKQKKERNQFFLTVYAFYVKIMDRKQSSKSSEFLQSKGQKQIVIMHEFLEYKLKDQIHKRQQNQIYFSQSVLWNIFYTLLCTAQYLKNHTNDYGYLSINNLYYKDNHIKLLNPQFQFNYPNSHSIKSRQYYSPEVLEHFQNNKYLMNWRQFPKNNVYVIGMIMMQLSLLENCHSCYDMQYLTIAQSCIANKLDRIKNRYSSIFAQTISKALTYNNKKRPTANQLRKIVLVVVQQSKEFEGLNLNVSILENEQNANNLKHLNNLKSTHINSLGPSNALESCQNYKTQDNTSTHKKSENSLNSLNSLRKTPFKSKQDLASTNLKNPIHFRNPSDHSTGSEKNPFSCLHKLKLNCFEHSIASFGSFQKGEKQQDCQNSSIFKQYCKMCQTIDLRNISKNCEQVFFENIELKKQKTNQLQKDQRILDEDISGDIAKFKQFLFKQDSSPIPNHKPTLSTFTIDDQSVKVNIKSGFASEQTHPAYPKQLLRRKQLNKNIDIVEFSISNSSSSQHQQSISFSPLLRQSSKKNYLRNQSSTPFITSIQISEQF